ncbi:dihydrofolate reductase family protein [Ruegeria lacuscaerulensis]|uniref:dihydrofolate reductase family protein n=1 Tax=Ruegeria lacuscaerulensis TaxID=55218 RepID=UPI001479F6F6|nr:dihydrofolate reductase family protein [Ruegeria lacuscaerulensis]
MTTGHIMMAMSLDGFVARPDHALDWLNKRATQDEDHGFAEFQGRMDAIVMGSGSFRTVLGFGEWPYTIPCIVMSRTMTDEDIPEDLRGKVEVTTLAPKSLLDSLEKRGLKQAYVDGGAIIRSFIQAGLIEDMKISIVPILLGDGIRIFGSNDTDIDLELVSSIAFPSGLVDLEYKVKR